MIIWLTGQPGSGKTTLARELKRRGVVDHVIDGDEMRSLRPEGYDYYGRHRNVERAQDVARFLDFHGHNVAVAVVAPHRKQRQVMRAVPGYHEVYLFGGYHKDPERWVSDYQAPDSYEACWINTAPQTSIEACIDWIVDYVRSRQESS